MKYSPSKFLRDSPRIKSKDFVNLVHKITGWPKFSIFILGFFFGRSKIILNIQLIYSSLGISNELENLIRAASANHNRGSSCDAELKEKLGCILLHVAALTNAFKFDPCIIFSEAWLKHAELPVGEAKKAAFIEARANSMVMHNGRLADLLKKNIFHEGSVDTIIFRIEK